MKSAEDEESVRLPATREFIGTNPTDEPITSGLLVIRQLSLEIVITEKSRSTRRLIRTNLAYAEPDYFVKKDGHRSSVQFLSSSNGRLAGRDLMFAGDYRQAHVRQAE